ncbi:FAD-dependent oxidoreductase, partial [Candidatus Sumerlaeota bacterium]|nr:FAD-dependent oxidoreductase [Candidatus Sumerlaeota bacterium]
MKDGSWASYAEAEQIARDLTYHPNQEFASDVLFDTVHPMIKSERGKPDKWRGVEKADLLSFRPRGVARMYVVSACAEALHEGALDRPSALIGMGTRIGQAAAKEAKSLPSPKGVKVAGAKAASVASGDVKESLVGVRPTMPLPTIPQEERSIPVIGEYDVVVVGGGTSGAPAGISAARQGAKTLVIEYLYGLGGVGTHGAISKYYHGYRGGFTREVAGALASWNIEPKMEWWRSALRQAGADIWFGAMGCGAFVDRGVVTGVVVATPQGRGIVLAKTVVDATGNADIAAAAGVSCLYTDESDIAMQGTGLPPRELGASYTNTDFTIVDETDIVDVSHVLVYTKDKYKPGTFDMGQLIDTRERRRVLGDYTLTVADEMTSRTYPDTVGLTMSNYDTHGYTVDPLFYIHHPSSRIEFRVYVPYRCILPKGLDGLLVVGLGVSAHRDAIPLIRMQPDLQNLGYAAGVAAAMTSRGNYPTRSVNIRELQKHLVEIGNLPPTVLTDEDS